MLQGSCRVDRKSFFEGSNLDPAAEHDMFRKGHDAFPGMFRSPVRILSSTAIAPCADGRTPHDDLPTLSFLRLRVTDAILANWISS